MPSHGLYILLNSSSARIIVSKEMNNGGTADTSYLSSPAAIHQETKFHLGQKDFVAISLPEILPSASEDHFKIALFTINRISFLFIAIFAELMGPITPKYMTGNRLGYRSWEENFFLWAGIDAYKLIFSTVKIYSDL